MKRLIAAAILLLSLSGCEVVQALDLVKLLPN